MSKSICKLKVLGFNIQYSIFNVQGFISVICQTNKIHNYYLYLRYEKEHTHNNFIVTLFNSALGFNNNVKRLLHNVQFPA